MPPPITINPNVIMPPVQQFPLPGTPADRLFRFQMEQLKQHRPWLLPKGLLDNNAQIAPVVPRSNPLQPVGDVKQGPWPLTPGQVVQGAQGLLHSPLGPGEMAPPGAGGGLLGSKWRDPAFVEKYAAEKGIPPGLLAPANKPLAPVVEHPTTKTNRLWDEGMKMSDARQEAMTVKTLKDLDVGARIQMHPATDTWMRGDRYGEVVGYNKAKNAFRVKMDASGRTIKVSPDNLFRNLPQDWVPPRSGEYRTPWNDITTEQWSKMNEMQQNVWKRDTGYEGWPATIRQAWRKKMDEPTPLADKVAADKAKQDFGVTIENIPQGGTVPLTTKGPPLTAAEKMDLQRAKLVSQDPEAMAALRAKVKSGKIPSAKDTGQTSMSDAEIAAAVFPGRDFGKYAGKVQSKEMAQLDKSVAGLKDMSIKQKAQDLTNKWGAHTFKAGMDPEKSARAIKAWTDAGMSDKMIKFNLAVLKQRGDL